MADNTSKIESNDGLSYIPLGRFTGMIIAKDGKPAVLELWNGHTERFTLGNATVEKLSTLFGLDKIQTK